MVAGALGNHRQFILHSLCLLLGDNLQGATMAGTLEDKVAPVDNLTGVQLLLGIFTLTTGRDTVGQLALAIAFGQWGQVVGSVIPYNITGRHIATGTKAELYGTTEGEEELIMVLGILHVNLVGKTQLQEFVSGIQEVSTPIAKRSHTEVVPAAPIALMIQVAEVMVADAAMPCIVVHTSGDGITFWHLGHVPVVLVPATVIVHMGHHLCNIFDDACFHPSLELEVVGF